MGRFRKPEVVRLDLTQGDWILIHSRLNVGQLRKVQARSAKRVFAGEAVEVDLEKAGISNTAEYLIDWSFTNHEGQPVVIRDQPADVVMQILSNLDPEDYNEIADAIAQHEKTLTEEKKRPATVSAS
jgi:hypothetical protein